MGTEMPELIDGEDQPDVSELQGRESTRRIVVPVRHEGPVRVQELPARDGAVRRLLVTDEPVQVAKPDLTRSRLVILAVDHPIYVAFSRDAVNSDIGWWPILEPLEIRATCEVWVRRANSSDAHLTVITENWTA